MENKDDIRKELNDLAPKLGGMEKKNPFQVPDYYFQGFPDKMLKKVKSEPTPWSERFEGSLNKIFSRIFSPRYAIPFATCLVLLAVSIGFLRNREAGLTTTTVQLSQIPTEEIDSYILRNFDDYELVALNGTIDVTASTEEKIIPEGMSTQELDDYLNDNIDNQTIEEEFL